MREYEEVVGLKHPAVKSSFRRAEQLLSSLPEEDRAKVHFWSPSLAQFDCPAIQMWSCPHPL